MNGYCILCVYAMLLYIKYHFTHQIVANERCSVVLLYQTENDDIYAIRRMNKTKVILTSPTILFEFENLYGECEWLVYGVWCTYLML